MSKNNLLNQVANYLKEYSNKNAPNRYILKNKNTTLSKKKVARFKLDISTLKKNKLALEQQYKELSKKSKEKEDYIKFVDESIKDSNRQKLIAETINLTKERDKLLEAQKSLSQEVNKLVFQKSMLEVEISDLEESKKKIIIKDSPFISIEYIDNLTSGFEFEECFATILSKLGFSDIEVTSGSGDFGIDVLAKDNNGILYGFQCKLYSNSVGNDAVQQAYAGKKHYKCDIAIVVTNSTFTEQATQQARETQIILWDRKILKNKLKIINN